MSEWIMNNLVAVIVANVVFAAILIAAIIFFVKQILSKRQFSRSFWLWLAVFGIASLLAYLLTGLDNSPLEI